MAGEIITDAAGQKFERRPDGSLAAYIEIGVDPSIQPALDVINGDAGAVADENWIPGAFGSAKFAPGSLNFDLCGWLYAKTGIKCWWIMAALAALVLVQAAGKVGRLKGQHR